MNKIELIGDLDNWMDFRDKLIEILENCDTSVKFEKFLNSFIISLHTNSKDANKVRKKLGIKPLTKKDLNKFKD